jgi:hypothetical protein
VSDSWSVTDSLLINLGIRYERPNYHISDAIRRDDGSGVSGLGSIHTFNNLAPRLGFTYKLDEEGKTLIRGSYGWYYESINTSMLQQMSNYASPWVEFFWDGADWVEYYREDPGIYSLDPDLKGQYYEAFTLGFERELMPNWAAGVDYVHRELRDPVAKFEDGNVYEPYPIAFEGKSYTIFNLVGGEPHYTIANADTGQFYNKYDGVILRLTKRYSDRWQAQASLAISNFRGVGGEEYEQAGGDDDFFSDPNNQINAAGKFHNHVPWNFKLTGAYTFPWDITVAGYANYRAGRAWTPVLYYGDDVLGQWDVEIFAETHGVNSYDNYFNLDLRAEKAFRFDRIQFSLLVDLYNIFNNSSVTDVIENIDLDEFGEINDLQDPRVIQVGVRLSF